MCTSRSPLWTHHHCNWLQQSVAQTIVVFTSFKAPFYQLGVNAQHSGAGLPELCWSIIQRKENALYKARFNLLAYLLKITVNSHIVKLLLAVTESDSQIASRGSNIQQQNEN